MARRLDARDDAPHAELPAEQRGQQVALVVVDDRDQHVAAADVLASSSSRSVPSPFSTSAAPQPARDAARPARVALDDRHVHAVGRVEPLGELQTHVAAADDGHALPLRLAARP